MVLDTGDASDSHLYQMAQRAAADARPFVVFYLCDFDPGGHNMPTSVSRKFQALCDLRFPDLDLRLYPVALTLEQCIEFDLPTAPLQPTEKRKAKWLARFGREQTELDALMALRPVSLKSYYTPPSDRSSMRRSTSGSMPPMRCRKTPTHGSRRCRHIPPRSRPSRRCARLQAQRRRN